MDQVARLPASERAVLFRETAARAGLASELIVEKDFWVCWSLGRLYGMKGLPRLLLKGGTSLSKCFGLIARFSEDIDLALDRAALGFGGAEDPAAHRSRNACQKAVKKLNETTHVYIAGEFVPRLRADFTDALAEPFTVEVDAQDPETVLFGYPRSMEGGLYGRAGRYVAPVVRLEMGARSDAHPVREAEIRPYAAEHFPDAFASPSCVVTAQALERTLLEKALILHSGCIRGKLPPRSSRHAYDLLMMSRGGVVPSLTRGLFEEVARHKLVFFDDKPASEAPAQGIRLVPEDAMLRALEADYRSMEEMFFREPPSFQAVVDELRALEATLNALPGMP